MNGRELNCFTANGLRLGIMATRWGKKGGKPAPVPPVMDGTAYGCADGRAYECMDGIYLLSVEQQSNKEE